MQEKSVSVVIPICSPSRELVAIVDRLLKQNKKPEEIILINSKRCFDGSEIILEEIEERFIENKDIIKTIEIDREEFDHGATRDMGIGEAKGEYVLLMTQDALPKDKNLISNMLEHFKDNQVAVVYARQLPKKDAGVIEKYTRSFNYGDEDIIKTSADFKTMGIKAIFSSDVCAMYHKEKYIEVGGFPSRTIFNEDGILAYKALTNEYKVVYASTAKVYHSHNYKLLDDFRRNFDLGVSQKQYEYIYDNLSSESEGIKLVKDTARYLFDTGNMLLIPLLILHSASKYAGYQAGKHYNKIPKEILEKCSMNKNYWKRGN